MAARGERAVAMEDGDGKNNAEEAEGQLYQCWSFLLPSTLLEYHMPPGGFVSWVEDYDYM